MLMTLYINDVTTWELHHAIILLYGYVGYVLRTMHTVRFVHIGKAFPSRCVIEYLSQKIMKCTVTIEQNNDSTNCKLHTTVIIYGTVFCGSDKYTLWERFNVIQLHVWVLAEKVHLIDTYMQQIYLICFLLYL